MFLYSNVLVVSRFQWPISFDIVSTKSVFIIYLINTPTNAHIFI